VAVTPEVLPSRCVVAEQRKAGKMTFFNRLLVLAGWVFVVIVEEIFRVLWIGDPRQARTGWFFSALLLTLLNFYSPIIGIFRFVLNVIHSLLLSVFRSFWLVFSLRCMEVGLVATLLFAGVFKSGLDPLPDRLHFPYLSVTNKSASFALEKPAPRTTRTGVNFGTAGRPWEELDGKDLRDIDLSARSDYLLTCNFSTLTRWPQGSKMASEFKPDTILDLGMNPGLQVRELHRRGITGAGVGIGIIDNVFYALHSEYKDNLRWYEEINSFLWRVPPEFHGSAVTSIALGKRCGVAPDADLYYIGLNGILFAGISVGHSIGYAINRLVSINEKLPPDRKIRVISISIEVRYPCPGYNYFMRAVDRAERNNIHVVFCSLDDRQKWWFLSGIGRKPYDDPDQLGAYALGGWYNTPYFLACAATNHLLYVPCDCRTFADHHSENAYRFFRNGGQSWQGPWIAGLYALCAQVNPNVRPESFYAAFDKTGDCITSQANGITNTFRPVANPIKMIKELTN
jgi:hypothetical protein